METQGDSSAEGIQKILAFVRQQRPVSGNLTKRMADACRLASPLALDEPEELLLLVISDYVENTVTDTDFAGALRKPSSNGF
jgi:hypothetical protein